ncbi:transporter substrate-binding domain-containing protein [Enterovibrio nigricans]|uniref:Polar amino acid transport system substrate-binding protein n=1 Tax=Enterovibrio nigricans DSM 22720 TaxID=1121868 RepID=A0A1T4VBH8_9GAMM|nr:transporter substrate-binding domain-containing protein [Enterovibrio nigricans]PKF49990.1 polar amino acid uptake family ABC transporter substrate-binding protein [Enterovibrio nigricans]SKA62305.1 polar amino acid transport system substrate-binding protein [Enterovibrio nigricans DSM 22720]
MKHLALPLFCFLAVFSTNVFALDLLSTIRLKGTLVVGVKVDYPPWGHLNTDGENSGFEIDLAKAVAKSLKVDIVFKAVSTANRFQKLNDGQVDMLIATVGDTIERRKQVNMVLPHYFRSGVTAISRKSYGIEGWEDLIGQPVCLTSGAYFNEHLIKNYRIDPVILSNNRDLKIALLTNKCKAWAYDSGILFTLSNQPAWHDYEIALETIIPIHWSFVTRNDAQSKSLDTWLSQFLSSRIRDGFIKNLATSWKLPEQDYLTQQQINWNQIDSSSRPLCNIKDRKERGYVFCFDAVLNLSKTDSIKTPIIDHFDIKMIAKSLLHTTLFTAIVIISAMSLSLVLGLLTLKTPNWIGAFVLSLTNIQSSVPPILMLYFIYFGVLASFQNYAQSWYASGTTIAWLVLSLYTASGINNLITVNRHDSIPLVQRYAKYRLGVTSNLVNLAKAAGMASIIASPNAVLIFNSVSSNSEHPILLMSVLAIFYYVEILVFAYFIKHCLSKIHGKEKHKENKTPLSDQEV